MSVDSQGASTTARPHSWLRRICLSLVPGPMTPLLDGVSQDLLAQFERMGHEILPGPDNRTDLIITTAVFGEPIGWRKAPLFTARRRFGLDHLPTVYALVHASPGDFQRVMGHLEAALRKEPPDPADYDFRGLAPQAYSVFFEQGRRGGTILALERLVQSQAKCLRIVFMVGDDKPEAAYFFDLAGSYPRTEAGHLPAFYEDIALRMLTATSTFEVNQHQVVDDPIPQTVWQSLSTPAAMRVAGRELGKRSFFTQMIRIADLVNVPALGEAVASQYSEGCFATWDPKIQALVATVTGSARPVDKGNITDDELAVIAGVRADGLGALRRLVEGARNDNPSSESVEMMAMDSMLPTITLGPSWGAQNEVPVVRSKLHGHRGVAGFDPRYVEHAPLDPAYYHYLVSCATAAQAQAISRAFARSEALQNPDDSRQMVFTVLPGHGVVIAEKWVPGTEPFQVIWDYMDAGFIEVENLIAQGPMTYVPDASGRMVLKRLD
jgi:hypothetical protein